MDAQIPRPHEHEQEYHGEAYAECDTDAYEKERKKNVHILDIFKDSVVVADIFFDAVHDGSIDRVGHADELEERRVIDDERGDLGAGFYRRGARLLRYERILSEYHPLADRADEFTLDHDLDRPVEDDVCASVGRLAFAEYRRIGAVAFERRMGKKRPYVFVFDPLKEIERTHVGKDGVYIMGVDGDDGLGHGRRIIASIHIVPYYREKSK